MKKIITILFTILTTVSFGQNNLNFSVGREYWQHTRLWGTHVGLEYSTPINDKLKFHFGLGFGYGEKNRLTEFPTSNVERTTLSVGYASSATIEYGFERKQTDNAKQFKANCGVSYRIPTILKQNLIFQTNIFGQKVNHFYVVDKLSDGYEVNYGFVIVGPIDVYIVSQQSFYTVGIEQKISYSFELKGGKYLSPFLIGGFGYNQTSFYGIGISGGGVL